MARVKISGLLIIATLGMLLCTSCGPRMYDQSKISPYKQKMPDIPSGTVPTTGRRLTNAFSEASIAKNPLKSDQVNLKNGEIFYGYYCLMCHGEKGDGNGPVGQSYVPRPADLSSPAIAKMTDGQLNKAMLVGVGHDPVMISTVLPEHRWPLVMYVRTFNQKPSALIPAK